MLIPITLATELDRDLSADRLLTRQGAVGIAVDQRCHGAYGTYDFETGEPMNFTQRKGARNWQACITCRTTVDSLICIESVHLQEGRSATGWARIGVYAALTG